MRWFDLKLIIISIFIIKIVLEAQDPQYYVLLMSKLSAEQKENLLDVIKTADQKKAQYNSKQIQKQGGNASVLAHVSQFTLA